jgi:hypothetical protein
MNARLFGVLLFVGILPGFTGVGITNERQTIILSAVLPAPPRHIIGVDRFVGCQILNVGRTIDSGRIEMFAPAKFGNEPSGASTFGLLEHERSTGVVTGLSEGFNSVFCRVTFEGKKGDLKGTLTVYSEGLAPLFTITFE